MQIETLNRLNITDKVEVMNNLINTLKSGDPNNNEGIAARVYFKSLFGSNFKRFNDDIVNFCLNYGYQIIRTKISQEIVSHGYHPSLGIYHRNEFNYFNLSDDFIEVFRPIIDYYIYKILENYDISFLSPSIKRDIVNILYKRVIFANVSQKIITVIRFFVQNMISYLSTNDKSKIVFPLLVDD